MHVHTIHQKRAEDLLGQPRCCSAGPFGSGASFRSQNKPEPVIASKAAGNDVDCMECFDHGVAGDLVGSGSPRQC